MSEPTIDRRFGRQAFGASPDGYHAGRPDYPDWVFQTLRERCGLARGVAVFEIGAGTGKATRRLLDLGADPVVALEPDPRLAAFLRQTAGDAALRVIVSSFEEAALDAASFDLGVCATAFHWLDENAALLKVADLLRPGGWWAAFWNVFGDTAAPIPSTMRRRRCFRDLPAHRWAATINPSLSMPRRASKRCAKSAGSILSSIVPPTGRSNSIRSRRSPSMALFPISTSAAIDSSFSPSWVASPAIIPRPRHPQHDHQPLHRSAPIISTRRAPGFRAYRRDS